MDTIADRLARIYGWSTEVRDAHRLRLHDLRGAQTLTILDEELELPARRTADAMDQYLAGLDDRIARAKAYCKTRDDLLLCRN